MQNRAPPYNVLFPEPRLLHYVFVQIFYPKDHSKEASNEIALEAVHHLMTGYSINYTSVILNHMYRIANWNRSPCLPYGNLLTRIFTHFKVPLHHEGCITQPVATILAHSVKTLRLYKIESFGWQLFSDLTPTEASSLKVTIPDQPFANIAEDRVE